MELTTRSRAAISVTCGYLAIYAYPSRLAFKCKSCCKHFSMTSVTNFHNRKLPMRDYLLATATSCNAVKGISDLQFRRDLSVEY